MQPIDSNSLLELGFERSGSTYTRGEEKLDYDGLYLCLNGEKIKDDLGIIKSIKAD